MVTLLSILGSAPFPLLPTSIVFTPVPGMLKAMVSLPPASLAALIASRRVQSRRKTCALHEPSSVSEVELTVKVVEARAGSAPVSNSKLKAAIATNRPNAKVFFSLPAEPTIPARSAPARAAAIVGNRRTNRRFIAFLSLLFLCAVSAVGVLRPLPPPSDRQCFKWCPVGCEIALVVVGAFGLVGAVGFHLEDLEIAGPVAAERYLVAVRGVGGFDVTRHVPVPSGFIVKISKSPVGLVPVSWLLENTILPSATGKTASAGSTSVINVRGAAATIAITIRRIGSCLISVSLPWRGVSSLSLPANY